MNLEDIKKNYENFDDEKLIQIARKDITSLRKEVVPILEAELLKRNLSLVDEKEQKTTDKKTKQSNKNEIFTEENIAFMKSFETPHILKHGKIYYIKSSFTFFFAALISFLFLLLFKPYYLGGIRLILSIIILSVLLKIVLSKIGFGKIAEVQRQKITLTKYPIVGFGIFRIILLVRIALNSLGKIEINYRDITSIYQKNTLTNKGYYIDVIDSVTREKLNYRVFLEILSNDDRKQILEVIKQKSVNLS